VTRLRQAVLAATDLDAIKTKLESFGLRDPFVDPGVNELGLRNAVYAIGDQFLELRVRTVWSIDLDVVPCRSAGLRRPQGAAIRFADGAGVMRIELEVDGTTVLLP
jgi:hypothetical protein